MALRKQIMELAHVGHQGIVKTKALIRSRVWYPGIDVQVEQMMEKCLACQANGEKQKLELMRPSTMPAGPWLEVSADFYGPMDDGKYWMVNYCDYSRYVFVHTLKSVAMDYVQPILEELFSMFGTPQVYKTDNGAPFMSHRFAEFAEQWGFKHRKVTPLWPRANGGAESVMLKLGKVVRTCEVTGKPRELGLQAFLRSYRATPHSVTKVAPAMLFLGFCRTSGIPMVEPDRASVGKFHERAIENDKRSKARMTEHFNQANKARACRFEVGDLVLHRWLRKRKSMPLWDPEPYEVVEMAGSMVTVARRDCSTTRNSSFFKLWEASGFEVIVDEQKPIDGKLETTKRLDGPANETTAVSEVEAIVETEVAAPVAEEGIREDPWVEEVSQEFLRGRQESVNAKPKYPVGRPTKQQQADRKEAAEEVAKAMDASRQVRRSERVNKTKL
jgi:hypothetical protein